MNKPLIFATLLMAAVLSAGCPANVHELAATGNIGMLQSEVEKDPAKINAQDSLGRSPLHAACGQGQVETVRWLIEHGADVNKKDNDGDTPLHYAARSGDKEVCRMLIEAGADPAARNYKDQTPLHHAAYHQKETVILLIEKGASTEAEDELGETPIFNAVLTRETGVIKTLVALGADIDHRDKDGKTPLHYYVENGPLFQSMDGLVTRGENAQFNPETYKNMIEFLAGLGAGLDVPDVKGRTALHTAAAEERCEKISIGANGLSPAIYIQMLENPEAVSILTRLGANLEAQDVDGHSPLHLAVINKHDKCVKELIKAGADLNAKDKDGKTPMGYTVIYDCPACAAHLKEAGAEK